MPKKGDVNNPTGKGGFGENPENRSPGGWKKEESIPWLQNRFGRMQLDELEAYEPQTTFEAAARNAVLKAAGALDYLKEVTDRTSGKSQQYIEHTGSMTTKVIRPGTEDE